MGVDSPDPRPPHSGIFFAVTVNFDLFGNPFVEKPRRRGRPKHEATAKTRKRVSMLVALGWGNQRIASTLQITLPTLHKYYFYELAEREAARDMLEARRLEIAWDMAEGGNVGALREFGKLLDRNDRMEAERLFENSPDAAVEKPERIGKKKMDDLRALDADADLMAELEREASHNAHH
ncbi:hypothetical protein [Martelella endophytica]|nr:hypothetical protein [Martelella endophytica]